MQNGLRSLGSPKKNENKGSTAISNAQGSLVDYLREKYQNLPQSNSSCFSLLDENAGEITAADLMDKTRSEEEFTDKEATSSDRRFSILSFSSVSTAAFFSADEGSMSETTIDYFSPCEDLILSTDDFFSPDSEHYFSPRNLKRPEKTIDACSLPSPPRDDEGLFIPRSIPSSPYNDQQVDDNTEKIGDTFQITAFNSINPVSSDDQKGTLDSGEVTPVPQITLDHLEGQVMPYSPPYFIEGLTNITTQTMKVATFSCLISAYPPPIISWYKNGERIRSAPCFEDSSMMRKSINSDVNSNRLLISNKAIDSRHRSTLTIRETENNDTGEYTVAASNNYGNVVSTAFFQVQSVIAPYFDVIMEDIHTVEGSRVVFAVSIFGSPPPTVTWLKDGVELNQANVHATCNKEQHFLHITQARTIDGGIYSCKGFSSAGQVVCKAELTVNLITALSFDGSRIPDMTETLEQRYIIGEVIGEGTGSVIKMSTCNKSGNKYAAKYINHAKYNKEIAEREIDILSKINHQNIVKYENTYNTLNHVVIVTELCEKQLFDHLLSEENLSERKVACFVRQLCSALSYLHQIDIIHLDIQPANLLVRCNQLKLIDFGNAVVLNEDRLAYCDRGTPDFVAPEIVARSPVTSSADMWSVGIVTFAAITGTLPFTGETDQSTLCRVREGNWSFPFEFRDILSQVSKDFLKNLIARNEEDRLSASSCLDHPWLKNLSPDETATVLFTKHLRGLQSERIYQKFLSSGKSTCATSSISFLLQGEYNSKIVAIASPVPSTTGLSSSETDFEVTPEEGSFTPTLLIQSATPHTSPASKRRVLFGKSKSLSGSMERPLQLTPNYSADTLELDPAMVADNQSNAHKSPLQVTKRRNQRDPEKCIRLTPKLFNIGKKQVSFEDEHTSEQVLTTENGSQRSDKDEIFSKRAEEVEKIEKSKELNKSSSMDTLRAARGRNIMLDQNKRKSTSKKRKRGNCSTRQRSYEVPSSSSEESESGKSTRNVILATSNQLRIENGKNICDYTPVVTTLPKTQKPRKGILKKGSSLDIYETATWEHSKIEFMHGAQPKEVTSPIRKFSKVSPLLDSKKFYKCTSGSGLGALSTKAKRHLFMQRAASADSALSPTLARTSGLRGPLFERHNSALKDETMTAGALMRQSPAVKQVKNQHEVKKHSKNDKKKTFF